jgi:hypothetical protein
MTALDDLRHWADIIARNRQTICCRPEQETVVREALDLAGQATWFEVRTSDDVPPGLLYIVQESG